MPFRGVGYEESWPYTTVQCRIFCAILGPHYVQKSEKSARRTTWFAGKARNKRSLKEFFFKSKASTKGMKKQFLIYFSNIVHCVYLGMAHTLIQIQYSSSKCSFHAGNQIIPIFSSTGFEFFSEFTI